MTNINSRRARQIRERQLKIRIALMIGIIITLILCLVFSIRASAKTDNSDMSPASKQYKSVMIYCNDSVESIAKEYYSAEYSSVDKLEDEIMSINHLSADSALIPGNYIVVPYYSI